MQPVLFLAGALLLLCIPSAQAAPVIDQRGVALLDREVKRIQSLKSFAVEAEETHEEGGGTHTSRLHMSLQWPLRAALRVEVKSNEGDDARSGWLLLGANKEFGALAGRMADTETIEPQDEREKLLRDLIGGIPSAAYWFRGAPSLERSFLKFAAGVNPAREKSATSVRVAPVRDGKKGQMLQNVVVQQKIFDAWETSETLEYGFDKQGHLRRLREQIVSNGRTSSVQARFGVPISNWKGTQARTDALVYAWPIVAPDVASRPVTQPKADVSPQARAIFARARNLYLNAKGLHLKWTFHQLGDGTTETDNGSKEERELRWDKPNRLFLKGGAMMFPQVAVDGKTSVQLHDVANQYWVRTLPPGAAKEEVEADLEDATNKENALFLVVEKNVLSAKEIAEAQKERLFDTLRARVLAPQFFGGQTCDLVRVTQTQRDTSEDPVQGPQQTFWFARSDGRLVRWQNQSDNTDSQVTLQDFNPKFKPEDFVIVPPQGAVRVDDD